MVIAREFSIGNRNASRLSINLAPSQKMDIRQLLWMPFRTGVNDILKMGLITYEPVTHSYAALGETVGKAISAGNALKWNSPTLNQDCLFP